MGNSMASNQAVLNTEEAPLAARTPGIVLLSIAALLIVVGAVASLSETTDPAQVASTGLADAVQQPTDLKSLVSFPDSFRIVDARMEAERAAFHNSQSHHKGRRLLNKRRLFNKPVPKPRSQLSYTSRRRVFSFRR